jgi:hypothetical protein
VKTLAVHVGFNRQAKQEFNNFASRLRVSNQLLSRHLFVPHEFCQQLISLHSDNYFFTFSGPKQALKKT